MKFSDIMTENPVDPTDKINPDDQKKQSTPITEVGQKNYTPPITTEQQKEDKIPHHEHPISREEEGEKERNKREELDNEKPDMPHKHEIKTTTAEGDNRQGK